MRKILFLIVSVCAVIQSTAQPNNVFNVRDFGATGEKNVLVTKNIQQTIDRCAASGGGTVYFPPGDYLSGPITLHSNLQIQLDACATLLASRDPKDYTIDSGYKADQQPTSSFKTTFLRGENLENISITGMGTIDGQAEQIWNPLAEVDGFIRFETENAQRVGIPMERAYQKDPKVRLVYLMFCKNIVIKGVIIKDSPDWNLHLGRCSEVRIEDIKIRSSLTKGVNSDGIDIDACKNVVVSGCIIETGDDAICLKTTNLEGEIASCENIIVDNCICTSTSTALKLGTESYGDFKNIHFNNCIIRNSNRGLSIVVRDGANVSDVKFSNISLELNRKHFNWWGNADPIWLVVLKRNENSKVGSIKNVTFDNISGSCQGTSRIEGFPGKPLENIRFNDVALTINSESLPDKRATHGFLANDVTNLSMYNCELRWNGEKPESNWSSAFVFENIQDLRLDKISGKQAPRSEEPAIHLSNVQNGIIERCFAASGTKTFFQVSGVKTKNLTFRNNYLKNARVAFERTENVNTSEVNFETSKNRNND